MLKKLYLLIFCCGIISFSKAAAGGVILYEIGTPDVGLASAGWAARAEDAATVFTNPAGMTRFKKPQFLFGAQPLYQNIKFNPNSKTTVSGTNGNASTWFPGGGSYFVMPLNDCVSIGAATLGYFGAPLDYGDSWVGRYYLNRAFSAGFSFVPGIAYRIDESLSIGLSANVMYSVFRSHVQVNNLLDNLPDGTLRATGNNWAVGAILGVLYELNECTRFGLQYVSEVKQTYNMNPKLLNIGPTLTEALKNSGVLNSKLSVVSNVPNWIMISAYKKLNPSIALMGNIGWQQWSKFAQAEIELDAPNSPSLTAVPKYQDTWHSALGMEYFFNETSKATLGIAFDSSMVKNKNRTVTLPVGQQWRIGTGYQFAYTECVTLSAAYEFMWCGDLPLFQSRGPLAGTVAGNYKNLSIHFVNLSLIWNF